MISFLARLIATIVFVSGVAPASADATMPAPDARSTDPIAAKFDYGRRLIAPVRVEGGGPHDFIVDTAASKTILFQNLATRLTIEPHDGPDISVLGLTGVRVAPPFRVGDISLGAKTLADHIAPILPDWRDAARTPQGILGVDFFEDDVVVFDPSERTIRIFPPEDRQLKTLLASWRRADLRRSTFDISDTPLYIVDVRLGRSSIPFLVDTGSDSTFVNFPSLDFLNVLPKRSRQKSKDGISDVHGDTVEAFILHTPPLTIGQARWPESTMLVADAEIISQIGFGDEPFGVLGLDFLTRQRFAVDFANNAIWFERDFEN